MWGGSVLRLWFLVKQMLGRAFTASSDLCSGDECCLPLRHLQEGLQNDLRAAVGLAVMEQGWEDARSAA